MNSVRTDHNDNQTSVSDTNQIIYVVREEKQFNENQIFLFLSQTLT